jgi:hypothetical protein
VILGMTPDPRMRRRKLLRFGTCLAGCLAIALAAAPPASASRLWVRPSAGPGLCCEADVVAQGPDNSLIYYHALASNVLVPQWHPAQIGGAGITFSAPSIVDRGGSEVDFAFTGVQNSLWYYDQTGYGPVEPSQVSGYNTAYG